MNERIKQIEEQCYIKPGGYYPGSDWPEPFFDKHKFAELIVQECALACVRTGVLEQDEDTGKMYADSVKEHFGIEE